MILNDKKIRDRIILTLALVGFCVCLAGFVLGTLGGGLSLAGIIMIVAGFATLFGGMGTWSFFEEPEETGLENIVDDSLETSAAPTSTPTPRVDSAPYQGKSLFEDDKGEDKKIQEGVAFKLN